MLEKSMNNIEAGRSDSTSFFIVKIENRNIWDMVKKFSAIFGIWVLEFSAIFGGIEIRPY